MTLTNIPVVELTQAQIVTNATNDIRQKVAQVISLADIRLTEIRNLIREHTRAAIAAELGPDAGDMLTVYSKLKEAVETAKQIEVDDLP